MRSAHIRVDGDGNIHRSEVLSKLPPFVAMSGGVDKAGPAAAPTDTAPLSDEEHGEEGRQESRQLTGVRPQRREQTEGFKPW